MFESMTYEALLKRALARVSSTMDKREGSMVFNGVAPSMAELAQLYIEADFILRASRISTAPRAHLIEIAECRNLSPYPATAAVFRGEFDAEIGIGARFSCDDFNFEVTARLPERDAEGLPVPNCVINGLTASDGSNAITNAAGVATGTAISGRTLLIDPVDYVDLDNKSYAIPADSDGKISIQLSYRKAGTMLEFLTSRTIRFIKARTVDLCLIGGGQGGGTGDVSGGWTSGGAGGKILNVLSVAMDTGARTLVVGAGGAAATSSGKNGSTGGNTTFGGYNSGNGSSADLAFNDNSLNYGGNGGNGGYAVDFPGTPGTGGSGVRLGGNGGNGSRGVSSTSPKGYSGGGGGGGGAVRGSNGTAATSSRIGYGGAGGAGGLLIKF